MVVLPCFTCTETFSSVVPNGIADAETAVFGSATSPGPRVVPAMLKLEPCAIAPAGSKDDTWLAALATPVTAGVPGAGLPAAWTIVTVVSAMVKVPVRAAIMGFASAAKSTSPLPVPDWPRVILIQSGLSVAAVQRQPA